MNGTPAPLPQDWLESGVDPDIIRLNVEAVTGEQAFEFIYGLSAKRRNDGRLRDHYLKIYRQYQTLDGWECHGVDPQTGETMEWGRFRITSGKLIDRHRGKAQRYVSPAWGAGSSRLTFLRVPTHIWERIANRYNVPITEADRAHMGGFWAWVLAHPEIPVILAEGEKKAGALLTQGFAVIALPGIWQGYRNPKFPGSQVPIGRPKLHPDLALFDAPGREVVFCFDREQEAKKQKTVNSAIDRTAGCFRQARVTVATLPGPQKGADDFLAAGGDFESVYESRISHKIWKGTQLWALSHPAQHICRRYLGDIRDMLRAGTINAIKSHKGTGKTHSLKTIVAENTARGTRTLLLTHRIVLGQAICDRVGLPWIQELKQCQEGGLLGFGLCVDSLHPYGLARIQPEEWAGAILIIDEVEQVVWHLLNASTCYKQRVAILQTLRELVRVILATGGQIIAQDADLSDASIDFLCQLAGFPVTPNIILNDWQPGQENQWKVTYYNTQGKSRQDCPSALLANSVSAVRAGGKIWTCVDAQKAKSLYGTKNLERYYRRMCPDARLLRIDSETVADPQHPAFACAGHINSIVRDWDIVICSPSLATGVSIDIRGHFTGVYGVFQGVISANEVCQSLARVREPVPRHVWVRRRGVSLVGDGSPLPAGVMRSVTKTAKANLFLLQEADFSEEEYDPIALRTWAKLAARHNAEALYLRDSAQNRLQEEGHAVIETDGTDGPTAETVREERDAGWEEEALAVTSAPDISSSDCERLQDKRTRTETERHSEEKYRLKSRYGEVSKTVKKLNDQKWYSQIRLHYLLSLADWGQVQSADRKQLAGARERGSGEVYIPDLRLNSAKIAILRALGVERFLTGEGEFTQTSPEVVGLAQKCLAYRRDIKSALNLAISEKMSPIRILQNVLGILGLRLTGKQRRVAGDSHRRERVYRFTGADGDMFAASSNRWEREEAPDLRWRVFEYWAALDAAGADTSVSCMMSQQFFNLITAYET
ncbi:MAG: DUF3854 domain-containing protein [Oscillatoria princeps RMCB-10]|jgi:hypothetical protein|nr:DUF3854 domain-containing protein [Oscillatoria princeps RMCB-10]